MSMFYLDFYKGPKPQIAWDIDPFVGLIKESCIASFGYVQQYTIVNKQFYIYLFTLSITTLGT